MIELLPNAFLLVSFFPGESESGPFRFRTAQVFDFAAAMFAFQPSFLRCQCGLCLFTDFGPLGCPADQIDQAGNGVLAVLFLGAKAPGVDEKITVLGHSLSGQMVKTFPNSFGKGRRMGHIEAKLHGRSNLIDILSARAGGTDELQMNFSLVD